MDDIEYYSLMRKQNYHHISLKNKKNTSEYKNWEKAQGKDDAEMLQEKKENEKN